MIYRYKIEQTEYTTLRFQHPHYEADDSLRCTELATVGEWSYVHVPESLDLPDQPVALERVRVTPKLKKMMREESKYARMVKRWRSKEYPRPDLNGLMRSFGL